MAMDFTKPFVMRSGPRADCYRIRNVVESAYQHLEDQSHRARDRARTDPDFAAINTQLQLAMSHAAKACELAEAKRRKLFVAENGDGAVARAQDAKSTIATMWSDGESPAEISRP